MISFELARPEDVPTLTQVQVLTFNDDSQRFLGTPVGGPPGYDSEMWNRHILRVGLYYKVVCDRQIVGGMIVFRMTRRHYNLGRIYIHPAFQNRGIGAQALRFLETTYPQVKRWTLDTPVWAVCNHHFYQKHGYRRVRQEGEAVFYEKRMRG